MQDGFMNNYWIDFALISLKKFSLVTGYPIYFRMPKKSIQETTNFVLRRQSYHVRELCFTTHLSNLRTKIWAVSRARIEKNIKVQNSNYFSNLYSQNIKPQQKECHLVKYNTKMICWEISSKRVNINPTKQ